MLIISNRKIITKPDLVTLLIVILWNSSTNDLNLKKIIKILQTAQKIIRQKNPIILTEKVKFKMILETQQTQTFKAMVLETL